MSTTETVTSTKLPQWLEDAYTNYLTKAGEATGKGYQPYTAGPRIAAYAPERIEAYNMVSENVGNYKPYVNAAGNYITNATKSFTDPSVVASYMNPYTENVVSGIGAAAGRNLYENLLPNVNRTFVGGGTFGGSRSAEFTARAVRDANAAALAEQNKALREGYTSGMEQFNTESGRYLTAADKALALGQGVQGLAGTDASALEAVGRAKEAEAQKSIDLEQADFEAQRDYDYNEALRLQRLIGTPTATGAGGTEIKTAPGANTTAQDIGAGVGAVSTLIDLFGKKDGGPISRAGIGGMKKAGPVMADGKRNLKHPMHGLGWLKDVK